MPSAHPAPHGGVAVEKTVRLVICGAGHMGNVHLTHLTNNPRAVIAGIYDNDPRDPAKAQRAAEDARLKGVPTSFADHEEMFERCQPQGVVIASSTASHNLLATAALDRGIHAFVEKPVSETFAEAFALAELADARQCQLMVGFHLPRQVVITELLRQEGSTRRGEAWWRSNKGVPPGDPASIGVLQDLGGHPLAAFLEATGYQTPKYVTAHVTTERLDGRAFEVVAFVLVAFDDFWLKLDAAWVDFPHSTHGDRPPIDDVGISVACSTRGYDNPLTTTLTDPARAVMVRDNDYRGTGERWSLRRHEPPPTEAECRQQQADEIVACCLGEARFLVDGWKGACVTGVLEVAAQSAAMGGKQLEPTHLAPAFERVRAREAEVAR